MSRKKSTKKVIILFVILLSLGILTGLNIAFWKHRRPVSRIAIQYGFQTTKAGGGSGEETGITEQISPEKVSKHYKGRIAIVIDDFGYPSKSYPYFITLKAPLNISILPNHRLSAKIAILAHKNNKEVLLHLPMQPYGKSHLEKDTIMKYMKNSVIEKIVRRDIDSIPYAVGVNNHMGSLITEDKRIMKIVLSIIKEKGLFFIDSRTSYHSIAYKVARKMKVRCGYNSLFIDNKRDENFTKHYLLIAARLAIRKKAIIVIGHDNMSTFMAIRDIIPVFKRMGVGLEYASEVVKQ